MSSETVREKELGALAKKFRTAAGKSRADAARDLRVAPSAVFNAEEEPARSLFKLRKRIIEKYSDYKVEGPEYRLKKKSGS
jgi:hypothetical protein